MGKIVALGGGCFDNGEMQNVAEYIFSLTGKEHPSFLFLPTAGHDNLDGDTTLIMCFANLGCCVADVLLLSNPFITEEIVEKRIGEADIIYAGGGNLEFLMNTWKRTGADKALKKAYERGAVLCGVSSGAMCWFKEGYDDCGENSSFMFVDCLDLIPFTSTPHYQSEYWQTFKEAIKGRGLSGIAMDNGAGFCYIDGEYKTVCGNEDGDCFYYDALNGYSETNLTTYPSLLKELDRY